MMRIAISGFVLFVLLFTSCGAAAVSPRPANVPLAVFGYLPEYRLNGFNYDAAFQTGLTHLIYFSLEVNPDLNIPWALDRLPSLEQAKEARKAADKVGGKILLGFGGNARSNGFAQMAATPDSRSKFLKALDRMLAKYDFDGVDYNWEYPRNEKEWSDWGLLMQATKVLLAPTRNLVTFTMFADENHAKVINAFNLMQHADFVHCMTYDMQGKHSTYDFALKTIKMAKRQELPLGKFTLGVPFYARSVKNGEPKTYAELVGPYDLQSKPQINQVGDYYFNGAKTMSKKTELAWNSLLGGIMIWELGQDVQPLSDKGSLMSAIHSTITSKKMEDKKESDEEL